MRTLEVQRFYPDNTASYRPIIAVSACLLGHAVRYDGGNKTHSLLHEVILPHVNVLARCPETEAGLGVPRQPVQLIASDHGLLARGRDEPELDVTDALRDSSRDALHLLGQTPLLCGHIFKSRSPSCGLSSTPVHDSGGRVIDLGDGIYADTVASNFPWLILSEETPLDSREACEIFLENIFIARDIQLAGIQQQLILVHRHYIALWQHSAQSEQLDALAEKNLWREYLATLLKLLR